MSTDVLTLVGQLVTAGGTGICALAVIRGIQIRRALINKVYRRRALWISLVSLYALVYILLGSDLAATVPILLNLILATASLLPLVAFVFVDSAILAAMETDFFHRDALRWRRLRGLAFVVQLALFLVLIVVYFVYLRHLSILFLYFAFVIVGASTLGLAYSVAVLVVVSRRSSDRTMRKHTRLLGLLLALVVVLLPDLFVFPNIPLGIFLGLAIPYLLYLSAMSLSQTNRIEKLKA